MRGFFDCIFIVALQKGTRLSGKVQDPQGSAKQDFWIYRVFLQSQTSPFGDRVSHTHSMRTNVRLCCV